MHFPDDMTFQYFFFVTYPGYFLQVLPIALLAGIAYLIIKHRKDTAMPTRKKIFGALFVCYMAGLVCLVLAIDIIGSVWYRLLYHQDDGLVIRMFAWDCNFIPYFFTQFNSEMIANIVLFLPFGILFPLSKPETTWKKTLLVGFLCIVGIEVLQPVFGRAFDVNDICLNMIGVGVSSFMFFMCKKMIKGRLHSQ